jgi:hypothetical protein
MMAIILAETRLVCDQQKRLNMVGYCYTLVGIDRLDAETVGSNVAYGKSVCPCRFIIIGLSPYHRRYIVWLLRNRPKQTINRKYQLLRLTFSWFYLVFSTNAVIILLNTLQSQF